MDMIICLHKENAKGRSKRWNTNLMSQKTNANVLHKVGSCRHMASPHFLKAFLSLTDGPKCTSATESEEHCLATAFCNYATIHSGQSSDLCNFATVRSYYAVACYLALSLSLSYSLFTTHLLP